jgi:H+-transporting ATPase
MQVFLSSIVFAWAMLSDQSFRDSLNFTVVLIVASIPMAVEIVCTTTLALGRWVVRLLL